ncbi:exopolyphosphatase-like enzyme [Leptolyngbyaceae cyanobacterium JSC-12]|nr:exopolyphosphatase-like enzyme [Leptolyngbyaceae cyanobacterium JSC-12]
MSQPQKTVVLSHFDCPDGAASIYAAYRYFEDRAEYHLINYQEPLPPINPGAQVYFLDMSRPGDEYLELLSQGSSVTVIDHHESALVEAIILAAKLNFTEMSLNKVIVKDDDSFFPLYDLLTTKIKNQPVTAELTACVEDWIDQNGLEALSYTYRQKDSLLSINVDMRRSGAYLAWKEFHWTTPPELIQYVDDRDRWVWRMPFSEEVNAGQYDLWYQTYVGINTNSLEQRVLNQKDPMLAVRCFEELIKDPDGIERLIQLGKPAIEKQRAAVKDMCREIHTITIDGVQYPYVYASIYHSHVGHYLLETLDAPVAVTWKTYPDNSYGFSIRTNGTVRANRIAKRFGGGGHKPAAGFGLKPLKLVKIGEQFMTPQVIGKVGGDLELTSIQDVFELTEAGVVNSIGETFQLDPETLVSVVKS